MGQYTVTIVKSGFSARRFENVEQAIGMTRTLDAILPVAGKGDQVTVAGQVVELDQTTASLGGRTGQKQVTGLPLNGRNWSSLTALEPGAIDSGGSNMKSIRFAGRGLDDNNFTLDGVDATGILNPAQRGQGRLAIPTSSAEVWEDRSFPITHSSSPISRAIASALDRRSRASCRAIGSGRRPFPRWHPSSPDIPPATVPCWTQTQRSTLFQGSQKVDDNTGMLRLDHRFGDSLTGFVRYNQDEAVSNVPAGNIGIRQDVDTRPRNGVAGLFQVLSPKLTNAYKFGFNQEITHTATLSPLAYTISAPGFSSMTAGSTEDERGAALSVIDNVAGCAGITF